MEQRLIQDHRDRKVLHMVLQWGHPLGNHVKSTSKDPFPLYSNYFLNFLTFS